MPKIDLGNVMGEVNPETMIPFDDHSGEALPPNEDPSYDWSQEPEEGAGEGTDGEEDGEEQESPVYVPGVRESVAKMRSMNKLKDFMSNAKAAFMGLVTLGEMRQQLVNNGLCNIPGKYFLDAAYGKTLTDRVDQLNDDIEVVPTFLSDGSSYYDILNLNVIKAGKIANIQFSIRTKNTFSGYPGVSCLDGLPLPSIDILSFVVPTWQYTTNKPIRCEIRQGIEGGTLFLRNGTPSTDIDYFVMVSYITR